MMMIFVSYRCAFHILYVVFYWRYLPILNHLNVVFIFLYHLYLSIIIYFYLSMILIQFFCRNIILTQLNKHTSTAIQKISEERNASLTSLFYTNIRTNFTLIRYFSKIDALSPDIVPDLVLILIKFYCLNLRHCTVVRFY
jgi:hypothetical protein